MITNHKQRENWQGSLAASIATSQHMLDLISDIEELEATVDKLPKFADGVPVTKGAQMWMILDDIVSVRSTAVEWADLDEIDWSRQYSTREATKEEVQDEDNS